MPKILILGVTGMLGNAVFRFFDDPKKDTYEVVGTARTLSGLKSFNTSAIERIITGIDVGNHDLLVRLFAKVRPTIVINCIGLVKQLAASSDPLTVIPLNALFPHRLADLCATVGSRLIHISTDCVFSGNQGNYVESDIPDAKDLYGRSKLLGEVDYPHAITLRTSIIGHELVGNRSLVDWFLSQEKSVKGFTQAIFSGLPTVELAHVICNYVLAHPNLHGLYHVSSNPIDKYNLLNLVAEIYDKKIEIKPDDTVKIDRSLNSHRFSTATGYAAPAWDVLIKKMYDFH